jgi:hypothetical protein
MLRRLRQLCRQLALCRPLAFSPRVWRWISWSPALAAVLISNLRPLAPISHRPSPTWRRHLP